MKTIDPAKKNSVSISSLILSEDDIAKFNLEAEDLFMVQLSGAVYGPIHKEALRDNLLDLDPQGTAKIQHLGGEEWENPYTHPYFQRRKLSTVEQEVEITDTAEFIVVNAQGLKLGPFTSEEVEAKIAENAIRMTDQITFDDGNTWHKVHQIGRFDRRKNVIKNNLPVDAPRGNIHLVEVNSSTQNPTEEAIVALSIINNINTNKAADKAYQDIVLSTQGTTEKKNSHWLLTILTVTAIASAAYFAMQPSVNEREVAMPIETYKAPAKAPRPAPVAPKAPVQKREVASEFATAQTVERTKNVRPSENKKLKAFKDSEMYRQLGMEYKDDINETAVPSDFVEGEMVEPMQVLTDDELMELESKISRRFTIPGNTVKEGPESEEGLFDEETSSY